MGRRQGELTPTRFAERIEVHEETVRRWCDQALAGEQSRLRSEAVRRDVVGRYFIRREEISRLLGIP